MELTPDQVSAARGLMVHGREAIIGEIGQLVESEKPSVVDDVLDRLVEFLDKAGNIADGAGNDYT